MVYKDLNERWAVVTIKWNKKPCLGICWVWDVTGMPNVLPVKPAMKLKVQDFLARKIKGNDLKEK